MNVLDKGFVGHVCVCVHASPVQGTDHIGIVPSTILSNCLAISLLT